MIHVRLDGQQISTGIIPGVTIAPFNVATPGAIASPATVGVVAVHLLTSTAGTGELISIQNISTAGQIIFLDLTNLVTNAAFRWLLNPGDSMELINTDVDLWAIASAAAGTVAFSSLDN